MKLNFFVIYTIILVIDLPRIAAAKNQSFELSTEFSGETSSTALQDQLSKPGQRVWALGIKQESANSPFEIEANFSVINRDLDKFLIQEYAQDSQTPTVPIMRSLKDLGEPSEHIQGGINLIYRDSEQTNILSFTAPLSSDPLESKKIGLSTMWQPDAGRYVLGFELGFSQTKQPKTLYRRYYEDEPYRQSPNHLYTQEYKVWLEASLNSRLKLGSEVSNTNRSGFRPDVLGLKLLGKIALHDRMYASASIGQFKESGKQEPLDGQGYFELRYSELGFDFEPVFDLNVGLSYSYIMEYEKAAAHGGETRDLKSDQYGLALTNQGIFQDIGVKASVIRSEIGEIQRLFGGSITWRI